jgi:hypothetical protein
VRLVAWPRAKPDQGRLERGSLSVRSVACVQRSGRERRKGKPACRPVIGKRYLIGKSLERLASNRNRGTDEGTNPVDMSLFGFYAVMQVAYALAQLIRNLDRTQRR